LPLTVIKCNLVWFNVLQYNFLSRFLSEDSGNFTLTRLCSLGTYLCKLAEGVCCMGERGYQFSLFRSIRQMLL